MLGPVELAPGQSRSQPWALARATKPQPTSAASASVRTARVTIMPCLRSRSHFPAHTILARSVSRGIRKQECSAPIARTRLIYLVGKPEQPRVRHHVGAPCVGQDLHL